MNWKFMSIIKEEDFMIYFNSDFPLLCTLSIFCFAHILAITRCATTLALKVVDEELLTIKINSQQTAGNELNLTKLLYYPCNVNRGEAGSFFAEKHSSVLIAVCSLFIYFYWLNITDVLTARQKRINNNTNTQKKQRILTESMSQTEIKMT